MADIDIEAPGADEADLRAALLDIIGWPDDYDTVNVTADTPSIRAVPCKVAGFSVRTSSSGNIALYANSSNTGAAIWSGAVTAGQIVTFPAPYASFLGLSFDLVSGSANVDIYVL